VTQFGDVRVDGGAADAEQPSDRGDGVLRPCQQVTRVLDLLAGQRRGPATPVPASSRGLQPVPGALHDQLPDELGQRGEHMEDQPTAGSRCVERLVQRAEADPAFAQAAD
jgi:hypothetical protein